MKNGPFDGVLSFSQGSIFYRHLYTIVNHIDPESYNYVKDLLPKFLISISGTHFPNMKF
jgi:hypothetical protein